MRKPTFWIGVIQKVARLGRPASTAALVLAALSALAAGLLGAAATAGLGWAGAPALPSGAAAQELGATVFPGQRVWGGGDAEPFTASGDGEQTVYGFADYWVKHTGETRDVLGYARGARDRLAAAGWDVHGDVTFSSEVASETPIGTATFWATRDGLVLSYTGVLWGNRAAWDSDGAASFQLSRSAPAWLPALAVAGGLLAALAGWLIAGWASRRTAGDTVRTGVVAGFGGMAILLTVAVAVLGGLWSWQPDRPGDEVIWLGLRALTGVPGVMILGLALVALAAVRLRAALPAMLVLAGVVAAAGWHPPAAAACSPSGPPADPAPADVAHSRVARVYIAQDSTDEQRNYAEAAISRVWGTTSLWFHHDPEDEEYRYAYCDGGELIGDSGMRVPYFWEVGLSSPGAFGALVDEVASMPGVVAVRHGTER
ncbi:hypothetical protein AMIS_29930 [Actinoplanes missouriensis 431]|uniref:Uncharacterized protein n=1 Tax=Actinoplanes missouriensis (strain ATCC 14538 / DSM 43046 / CBS 188.64 / JCM 3121 / NBRC 102363 / NCIMB 12654 / NRRL B-3342 / UNCC 431) TaxID=512565 RepID=I0H5C6_ACTM4|nr:hypothetical protein [Actinoplanes missouriensis]BAL88213.1 hypothetical protein AMIS_29930 [Actinoplanes missouriensis 431]